MTYKLRFYKSARSVGADMYTRPGGPIGETWIRLPFASAGVHWIAVDSGVLAEGLTKNATIQVENHAEEGLAFTEETDHSGYAEKRYPFSWEQEETACTDTTKA